MKSQGKIAIGYVYGTRTEEFMDSLLDLREFDLLHNHLILARTKARGLYVDDNRNNCARQFLEMDPPADFHVVIDTDIQFDPEMVYALYEVADPVTRPIVSGIYFSRLKENQLCPVWFVDGTAGKYSTVKAIEGDAGQPQRLDAVGLGFCIIHRSVYEKIAKHPKYGRDQWTWFGRDEVDDPSDGMVHHLGEDLSFGRRCKEVGIPIYGHAGIQVGHVKQIIESYQGWLAQQHPEQLDKYEFKNGRVMGPKEESKIIMPKLSPNGRYVG